MGPKRLARGALIDSALIMSVALTKAPRMTVLVMGGVHHGQPVREAVILAQVRRGPVGVDHQNAAVLKPLVHLGDAHDGGVKNHDHVRFIDFFPVADGLAVHPQESLNGRAAPFRAEAGKSLSIFAFFNGGKGDQFGGCHRALDSATMKPDLNHLALLGCLS